VFGSELRTAALAAAGATLMAVVVAWSGASTADQPSAAIPSQSTGAVAGVMPHS
jgi:hypothetical protein